MSENIEKILQLAREFNTFEITNLCKPLKNGYFFVKFPTLVLSII